MVRKQRPELIDKKWVRVEVTGYIDVLTDTIRFYAPSTHVRHVKNTILEDGLINLVNDGNIKEIDDSNVKCNVYGIIREVTCVSKQ